MMRIARLPAADEASLPGDEAHIRLWREKRGEKEDPAK